MVIASDHRERGNPASQHIEKLDRHVAMLLAMTKDLYEYGSTENGRK